MTNKTAWFFFPSASERLMDVYYYTWFYNSRLVAVIESRLGCGESRPLPNGPVRIREWLAL